MHAHLHYILPVFPTAFTAVVLWYFHSRSSTDCHFYNHINSKVLAGLAGCKSWRIHEIVSKRQMWEWSLMELILIKFNSTCKSTEIIGTQDLTWNTPSTFNWPWSCVDFDDVELCGDKLWNCEPQLPRTTLPPHSSTSEVDIQKWKPLFFSKIIKEALVKISCLLDKSWLTSFNLSKIV